LGAAHVTIVYRRTERDLPAFGFEYEHAKLEGVSFEWLTQPVAIHTYPAGPIATLECVRMDVETGPIPTPLAGSNFHLLCDMVIPAIGQAPVESFLARCRGPKYYSGGDCVNGGREVVDAVADGKRAAVAIAKSFEEAYA